MSTLIVYMSRHSTTEKVAEMIKRGLKDDEIDIVNLGKTKIPDLSKYSKVIVGGSIHMGVIQKKIRRFCDENLDQLLNKKTGLFICYMDVTKGEEEFQSNYPQELQDKAIAHGLLGGEFLLEKMNFFERMIVKKISKINKSVSKLKSKAITEFIDKMNN